MKKKKKAKRKVSKHDVCIGLFVTLTALNDMAVWKEKCGKEPPNDVTAQKPTSTKRICICCNESDKIPYAVATIVCHFASAAFQPTKVAEWKNI